MDLETVFGLLSFTGEGDPAGGRVDEASDEHPLRGAFAGDILRHLIVKFIRPEHVTAVTVHATNSTTTALNKVD